MEKPRTTILSYALGTGHRQVADTLTAELASLGHDCEHRALEEWVPWEYDLLFRHGYLLLALRAPSVWDAMYRSPFFTKRGVLVFPVMRRRVVKRFGEMGFGSRDLVVVTQYNAMEVAADWKRDKRADLKLAVVLTDYDVYPLWARPEVDLFLVPHDDLRALLVARGVPAGKVFTTGIPVRPVFGGPTDAGAVKASLGLDPDRPLAMVFGGGGGYGPMEEAARACLGAARWQVVVVCGNNDALRSRLTSLARATPERLRVLGYRGDVPALMGASDAVVTKGGGLSLTEALYSGSRTLVVPGLPGQERANLAFMESHGWVEVCVDVSALGGMLDRARSVPGPDRGLPPAPAKAAAEVLDALARGGGGPERRVARGHGGPIPL